MKSQAVVLFAIFFVASAMVSIQEDGQFYCGRRLSSALAMLCENGLIKRSERMFHTTEDDGFPWIPAHHARSMGRGKRQVVSECCYKSCTINELLAYCAA